MEPPSFVPAARMNADKQFRSRLLVSADSSSAPDYLGMRTIPSWATEATNWPA